MAYLQKGWDKEQKQISPVTRQVIAQAILEMGDASELECSFWVFNHENSIAITDDKKIIFAVGFNDDSCTYYEFMPTSYKEVENYFNLFITTDGNSMKKIMRDRIAQK